MCGICGERSYGAPPAIETIRQMVGVLEHRGPDGSGCYRDVETALGHTRLSIIDAVGGAQPMSNEDGRVWVTFNGEIFNFPELTAQLTARGHRFRSRSDTEVIVHAWEEWGLDAFPRFNGQWALAIWDTRSRDLVLSRDRFGILPLYHTRVADRLLFASSVRALLTDQAVPRAFDPLGLDEVLTVWSTTGAQTVFAGVEQVPPGTSLVFGPHSPEPVAHRFWEPRFDGDTDATRSDLVTSSQRLRDALIEATRLRFLRSDVPVAAYLSGGIDSAVTAGIIAQYTDAELHTYSLRFADADFDEGSFQQAVAAQLGTHHHELTVTGAEIAAVFPEVIRHTEAPVLRTAPAPMMLLSRHVHESGHRVVVTGEGADELLAGYDLFREAAVRRFMARAPADATRARALELLYPWLQHNPNRAPAFARSFFARNSDPDDPYVSHRPRWDTTATLKGMLTEQMSSSIGAPPPEFPSGSERWDPLSRAQWLEIATLLPGYLLSSQGDRMLMANSVEGRFPFLDPDVADVAISLPARHRLNGLSEKEVLKAAFADLVPAAVLHRPKQPYRAPGATTIAGSDAPAWVDEILAADAVAEAGVFRHDAVTRLRAKAARGAPLGNTDSMRLIAVLSTQLLYGDLIAGPRPTGAGTPQPVIVHDSLRQVGEQ